MRSFDLSEAVEILRATPPTLRSMLGELSESWLNASSGAHTWSPLDIVAHLIAGEESDWIPRARIMLSHGVTEPFTPFAREPDRAEQRTPAKLLARLASLREENLAVLDTLALEGRSLDAKGIHPEFGEVRLGDMLAAWVVHDLSHIAQAAEVMAKRYAVDVGPWRRYLPIIDREELPSS